MMPSPVNKILNACHPAAQEGALKLSALVSLAGSIQLSDDDIDRLVHPDTDYPYGRRVLLNARHLEVMVATWTPGLPCAPHDHGGQLSAVRVLRGAAQHKVWQIKDGAARCARTHTVQPDEILAGGTDMIHSMGCAGDGPPLVTLHMYTDAIPYMIVYDLPTSQTVVVRSDCGAWLPAPGSPQELARLPGLWSRSRVSAWMAEQGGCVPAAG